MKKKTLIGTEAQQEGCVIDIGEDGTIYLLHVQADIWNKETGEHLGTVVLNDEIPLPISKFQWHPHT